MLIPRLIPILLLDGPGLVKTYQFKDKQYIGDPCNTVRIFNEKQVDELMLMDISCRRGTGIQFDRVRDIVSEAFMPLAYGGGIDSLDEAERLLQIGIEKLVLRTSAIRKPGFVEQVAKRFGTSTTVVCLDVVRVGTAWRLLTSEGPTEIEDLGSFLRQMEGSGAGEIILQSVARDGTLSGYDLDLIEQVAGQVDIPVVAAGGARSLTDISQAVKAGASAAAAGAFFVFQGRHRAVLITYPEPAEVNAMFGVQE